MTTRPIRISLLLGVAALLLALAAVPAMATGGTAAKVALGAMLAGDRSLSDPDGQACADCHFPKAGYSDPDADLAVSQGVDPKDFGGRNAPTWAYTAWSPDLHFDGEAWIGGMFWDGRASGWQLSPLAEQARGPFLNPVEMQNPSKSEVIREVRRAPYSALFRLVFGTNSLKNVDAAYDDVARAIAAYESSALVNTFSSRYDAYIAGNRRALSTAREARPRPLQRRGAVQPVSPEPARPGHLDRNRKGQSAVHRLHLRQPRDSEEPGLRAAAAQLRHDQRRRGTRRLPGDHRG